MNKKKMSKKVKETNSTKKALTKQKNLKAKYIISEMSRMNPPF